MKELDILLKSMADGMKIMADGINSIVDQLNKLAKTQAASEKTTAAGPANPPTKPAAGKAPAKKKAAKKSVKSGTAPEAVLEVIKNAEEGVDNKTIGEKTGFDAKKVANAVYRLKREGKIEPVSRGIYKAA